MKRYYILIILSVLLVLASTWTQASKKDTLSLFQANLKEQIIDSEHQSFGLKDNIDLKKWLKDLTQQGNLIAANKNKKKSSASGNLEEEKKLVSGIEFYSDQGEINNKSDFFSKEEIVIKEKAGMKLAILPGVLMNSNYQVEQGKVDSGITSDFKLKQQLGFDVDYEVSRKFNINTGYYLTGEKKKDSPNLTENEDWQFDFVGDEALTDNIKKIGINYDTSERTSVFANYLKEGSSDDKSTTVVGVKYNNNSDQITFQYQIEDSDEKKVNSTGVEFGINEFAKLKAIYTMIDDNSDNDSTEVSEENSEFESKLLDLGLDLRVSDDTSVKLGYQVNDKEEDGGSEEIWKKLKPSKANIELEVKF
ncbi:hypothetical protein [Sporohalobacter salinus]|uniref:hypothetical protein n=1 Tax=Sporohalobacter salinus TaxID=1494606 RepID=UPI00196032D3|nr:hypothetical protein [Sporohalobacter salinus]MBM7622944.1 hypothetical protein [Sporohalobacter salinus]